MFAALATSLAACSSHQTETLTAWPQRIDRNPIRDCEAHFKLRAESQDEQIVSDAILSLHLQNSRSAAELKILNTIYMTVAKLDVSAKEIHWSDQEGQKDIRSHPLFQQWFRSSWWVELAFLFGLPTKETQTKIMQNERGHPVQLDLSSRKIRCSYESSSEFPSSCQIEDKAFFAKLDFTSAECRSPL
jgi:hypothetical protein